MKVFISWSGDASGAVAQALRGWLPTVIQAVEPWMSSEDIAPGAKWLLEIVDRLEDTHVGITCLTPENLVSPWLAFEAGALSKAVRESTYVCPYLYRVKPSDLVGPLSVFQGVEATKKGTERLVRAINQALPEAGEKGIPEQNLCGIFNALWPQLEAELGGIELPKDVQKAERSEMDVLEEVLQTVRAIARGMARSQSLLAGPSFTEGMAGPPSPYNVFAQRQSAPQSWAGAIRSAHEQQLLDQWVQRFSEEQKQLILQAAARITRAEPTEVTSGGTDSDADRCEES